MSVTHIRTEHKRGVPICGAAPSESISYRHYQVAQAVPNRLLLDALPHPLCARCVAMATARTA